MIAKDCAVYISLPLALAIASSIAFIAYTSIIFGILFVIFASISLFFTIFLRDPERKISKGIVSPADGIVMICEKRKNENFIAIFMNVHNVHVNRAPIDGKIVSVRRITGEHKPAYSPDSEKNERVEILLDTDIGDVKVVQRVGIFARRIKPYIDVGDNVRKGDRIGIIMFGSRVDLHLPREKTELKVRKGDRVFAGETTVADIK